MLGSQLSRLKQQKYTLFSLLLHSVLGLLLFIQMPLIQKTEVVPVVNVQLITPKKEEVRAPTPAPPPKKASVVDKKKQERLEAIRRQNRIKEQKRKEQAIALKKKQEEALKKKRREEWLKKRALLKEKERQKKIAEQKAKKLAEARQRRQEQKAKEAAQKRREEEKRVARQKAEAERQERLAAQSRLQKTVALYVGRLRDSISNHWHYPLTATADMKASVIITLTPVGDVISAELIKGSGNQLFDESVLRAIQSAAPFDFFKQLNIGVFESHFRKITLTFSPQDLEQ